MNRFQIKQQQLRELGRYRMLSVGDGIDLTSNDYLGFKNHPELRSAAIAFLEGGGEIGSGGSRLLRGQTGAHAALEEFAADYFSTEKSLYFANGYQANAALFGTLPTRHDVIIYDALIHASAREAIHRSPAKSVKVAHNDFSAFEDVVTKHKDHAEHIWIAVESVYSMDGDIAPVAKLHSLACQHNATLVVDEAHGTGVMGETGKGVCESLPHKNLITMHTCGKALGVAGGLICATSDIIDMLINVARPFIYSTAPMPLQAHLTQEALILLQTEKGQVQLKKLKKLCEAAQEKFGGCGTHIVPIVLGDDHKAVEAAHAMQDAGYDIRAIRPPTVPEGTARLRLSLSANLDQEVLDGFSFALAPYFKREAA